MCIVTKRAQTHYLFHSFLQHSGKTVSFFRCIKKKKLVVAEMLWCYIVRMEEAQRNVSDGTKRVPTLRTDGAAHLTATDDQVIIILHIVHRTCQKVTRKNAYCVFIFKK
jgi:hypothetical protein